ncbi:MAG TPA: hypothetical protein VEY70_14275 [Metabacillus sp.]|nr:hypothetical protein [Metabacillus sp.]
MKNQGSSNQMEVTYKEGFPTEESPGLTEFIKGYLSRDGDNEVLKKDDTYVYSVSNKSENDRLVQYYRFTSDQLKRYYQPLVDANNSKEMLLQMNQSERKEDDLYQTIENTNEYQLPLISLEENNQLNIKTNESERTFDLPELMKEYGVKKSDNMVVNLKSLNNDHFVLEIQDFSVESAEGWDLFMTLFVKQDLSNIVVSELYDEDLQSKLDSGELKNYYEGFQKVDPSSQYSKMFENKIIDNKLNKIIDINKDDLLSKDGKYVYINGNNNDLSGGTQKIQSIGNYAKDNDTSEISFDLDLAEIAKRLDLDTSGNASVEVNYFNEDYIVLRLNYKGEFVGTAGATNVIIDLQNDKKIYYLVDLGLLGRI